MEGNSFCIEHIFKELDDEQDFSFCNPLSAENGAAAMDNGEKIDKGGCGMFCSRFNEEIHGHLAAYNSRKINKRWTDIVNPLPKSTVHIIFFTHALF